MKDERGTVYLLCYTGYVRPRDGRSQPLHYYGWAKRGDGQDRIRKHFNGTSGAALPTAMWATAGVECHVGRIWKDATRDDERRLKQGRNASRRCLRCRRARAGARVGETLEELLARSVEWAATKRRVRARRQRQEKGVTTPSR